MKLAMILVLGLLMTWLPSGDGYSAARIRLPEVIQLSQAIVQGEIVAVNKDDVSVEPSVPGARRVTLKVRVKRFLRGQHHVVPHLESQSMVWLTRNVGITPRIERRLRRHFSAPFDAKVGAQAVFFLPGDKSIIDARSQRTLLEFDWAGDPAKLRKLGSTLRKTLKAEGQRIRANSRCRYATFQVKGQCLSASGAFRTVRCPAGTRLQATKYRDFGLQLQCTSARTGKAEGPRYRWTEFGKLESKTMMAEGLANGARIDFGRDGAKRSSTEHRDGEPHGRIVHWHSNGKIRLEGRLDRGLPDGEFHQYSASGALLGSYTMAKGTGTLKRWREDGSLEVEAHYVNGSSEGLRRQYFANGALMSQGTMTMGRMNGLWLFYNSAGSIESSVCYEAMESSRSRQLWRRKKQPDIACPPGPETAQAE